MLDEIVKVAIEFKIKYPSVNVLVGGDFKCASDEHNFKQLNVQVLCGVTFLPTA